MLGSRFVNKSKQFLRTPEGRILTREFRCGNPGDRGEGAGLSMPGVAGIPGDPGRIDGRLATLNFGCAPPNRSVVDFNMLFEDVNRRNVDRSVRLLSQQEKC